MALTPAPAHLLQTHNRGFGVVRFPTEGAAMAAVEAMNNAEVGGRTVTVRIDRYA